MISSVLIYGLPLTAGISLVYCASRYEMPARILSSAAVMFLKTQLGLVVIYGILWMMSG
jgi:hypothetical protein